MDECIEIMDECTSSSYSSHVVQQLTADMSVAYVIHSKKRTTCSGLMKTGLNNVLLPTLF